MPNKAPRWTSVFFALTVFAVLAAGLYLRQWTWEKTDALRFSGDLRNGFYWGTEAMREGPLRGQSDPPPPIDTSWSQLARGYFGLYDRVRAQAYEREYNLDYPPLRLLVMTLWTRHVRTNHSGVEEGSADFAIPLRALNLFCELLSAALALVLVRSWLARTEKVHTANACGFAVALLVWFNPALILISHGWPQWDVWILPIYLMAVLAGCARRWLLCGGLLALGTMFKGQLLLVVPFFLLWPLVLRDWRAALSVLAGFLAAAALVVSPWMLRSASSWLLAAVCVGTAALLLARLKTRDPALWFTCLVPLVIFFFGAVAGGSFAWLQIGFLYGTERYPYLFVSASYNLPSILHGFGWQLKEAVVSVNIGGSQWTLTLQSTLRLLYVVALFFCAAAAARWFRESDRRFLVAVPMPWLLMFALLGQMHERYLLWGAVLSAVAIGAARSMVALTVVFSLLNVAMVLDVMLIFTPAVDPELNATLQPLRTIGPPLFLTLVAVQAAVLAGMRLPSQPRAKAAVAKPHLPTKA